MPSSDNADLLVAENVVAYRGTTRVFDGLTLTLPRHRHTAILGPNGAGKSTLLKLMNFEEHPVVRDDLRFILLGKERWVVPELRKKLGLVSHDLQARYTRNVTGFDVVLSGFWASIGLYQHQTYTEAEHQIARQQLEKLGISHLSDKPINQMSTGEQRRCLVARALVNAPHTLLLDEPTSGLDLQATFQLLETLRSLAAQGTTMVTVTHHLHEIIPEVSHVVMLKQGRLFAEGSKTELLRGDILSALYDIPLAVKQHGGFYQVFPDR